MVVHAVEVLEHLKAGTYEVYTHPALLAEEAGAEWPIGAGMDPFYRDASTKALMDPALREVIGRRKIRLIGYRDL